MSTNSFAGRFAGVSKFLTAFVVLALIAAALVLVSSRDGMRYVTVNFKAANSLYKGSDVKILGVPVGVVDSITPKGDVVQVKIAYQGDIKLPADVKAAVVSPSVVSDRFVQLSPAYSDGVVLKDNALVGVERTAVPIELDQVYSSLDDLAVALGPEGANKDGSLSNLLSNSAKSLDGQGVQLNETIKNFSKLSQTLSNNKEELFGSLDEVQEFVAMLRKNDASVRSFNDSTAQVSRVLEGERDDLAGTLKALGIALKDVRRLIKDNRGELRDNVDNLTVLSQTLADNSDSFEEMITAAPTALSNVAFTYNANYGTLDTRANLLETITGGLKDPGSLLCSLLGESSTDPLCSNLKGALDNLPLDDIGDSLPLPRAAVASGATPEPERVHSSVQDMLAVK